MKEVQKNFLVLLVFRHHDAKKNCGEAEKQLKEFLILEMSGSEFVGPTLRPL